MTTLLVPAAVMTISCLHATPTVHVVLCFCYCKLIRGCMALRSGDTSAAYMAITDSTRYAQLSVYIRLR